jgi:hypothetical protein
VLVLDSSNSLAWSKRSKSTGKADKLMNLIARAESIIQRQKTWKKSGKRAEEK